MSLSGNLTEVFDEETAGTLLSWFRENGVAYPWAESPDPWGIWVSEVMLQQTTVGAVEPRYRRWMDRFPTPEALAAAGEQEVLREWEGLGYYNRARNLASAATEIQRSYAGRIPEEVEELRRLPGVGEYIAAAVSSFAFGKRRAAIDANGRRIAQRLMARELWDKELERLFREAVEARMPSENPGEMNAALMQLGQLVCTPGKPLCVECPLVGICRARAEDIQESIPLRRRQEVIRKKTNLALCMDRGRVLVRKKTEGIGKGLWVFPSESEIENIAGYWEPAGSLPRRIHSYTRYREELLPRIFRAKKENGESAAGCLKEGKFVTPGELQRLPMPTAYRRIARNLPDFNKNTKSLLSLESRDS
jgi:A/G-specific adenine glycosylase